MKSLSVLVLFSLLATACQSVSPTTGPTGPTPIPSPTSIMLGNYRPLQAGDAVEGSRIGYQYLLPQRGQPAVDLAFGQGLLELITVKPPLEEGLVAFIREIAQKPATIYGFDEWDPNQAEPRSLTLETGRAVEVAFVPLAGGSHHWSVTETQDGEVREGYKLVRRKDGGLRFVDAYDVVAQHSMSFPTLNGGGMGLVFSSRLALLRMILADGKYQRGMDVMTPAPPTSQYDQRILKIDPTKEGLAQDLDWVLVSRPGPNPGQIAP